MNKKPILILIAGGSCSGKNTIAGKIADTAVKEGTVILDTDDFYRSDTKFQTSEEVNYNFNNSESVEWEVLTSKVKELLEEKDVLIPPIRGTANDKEEIWEHGVRKVKFTRIDDKEFRKPAPIIIVSGVHALQNEELRNLANLKIFTDTDIDLRMALKIKRSPYWKEFVGEPIRDVRNFGRPNQPETKGEKKFAESIINAFGLWNKIVKPSEMRWVIPTQKYADLVVQYSEMEDFPRNVEMVNSLINLYFNDPEKYQIKLKELKSDKETSIEELKNQISELQKQLKEEKERNLIIGKELEELKLQTNIEFPTK